MREIQDMTLNVSRGMERIDKRLAERAKGFEKETEHLYHSPTSCGIRLTAVPIGDEVSFDYVFRSRTILPELDVKWQKVILSKENREDRTLDVHHTNVPNFWRPLLRAARADSDSYFINRRSPSVVEPDHNCYKEVHCDGLVEYGYSVSSFPPPDELFFDPDIFVILLANLIVQADRIRQEAGAPTIEYGIEIQFLAMTQVVIGRPGRRSVGVIGPISVPFPRYSMRGFDTASDLLTFAKRDFYNVLGVDIDNWSESWTIKDQ